jgi:hypothetical protein
MSPTAEHSPYHDQRPLLHDFQYRMVDGVPVLDGAPREEEDEA